MKHRFVVISALSLLPATVLPAPLPAAAALAEKALAGAMDLRKPLGLDERHSFAARRVQTDTLGQSHVRLQQYYRGVRVWGGELIRHADRLGRDLPMTAALQRNIDLEVAPGITRAQALALVERDLSPSGPYASEPAIELVIYPVIAREIPATPDATEVVKRVDRHRLAYYVHTELENPGDTRHRDYLVDARDGTVFDKWDSLHTAAASGTGISQYSGTVGLDTDSTAGGFDLRDPTRPSSGGNAVYNLDHATSGNGTLYRDADNHWGDGANFREAPEPTDSANGQTAAVDAAFGIQTAWDLFRNVFGRNGIDGQGTPIYARVHYDNAYDNAFYSDYCLCITYGDGTKLQTLTTLDIAAHEFAHGVCSTTAGLIYSGESGGLNEANSDIIGAMAEFYARGAGGRGSVIPANGGNWTQGEQAITPAYPLKMRFLYKPSKDGKSADAWSPDLQNLDVHYSSGPMNRAFYFLSQGATTGGETASSYLPQGMAGIGNDPAAKIWFRALTTYMTSTSDYAGARIAMIQAVRDLFPLSGPEEIAVWNAFAAINVGRPWSGPDSPPTVTVSASGTQGSVEFRATASDDKGVTKVDFLVDGSLVGTRTAPPYSLLYDSLREDDGVHTLVARATDTSGQFSDAAIPFTIANGQLLRNGSFEKGYGVGWSNTPGIQIGAILGQTPYDGSKLAKLCGMGARLTAGLYQSVTIPAQTPSALLRYALHIETKERTTGTDHDILAVQIRDGSGTPLATLSSYSDRNAAAGYKVYSHDLAAFRGQTVQVYFQGTEDSAVATGFFLDQVNLLVAVGGTTDPEAPLVQVAVTGSTGRIGFSASASDNVGVTRVEFWVDGVLRGTVERPPYSLAFDSTTLANGSHSLTAKAYDAAGNVGVSAPVDFTVNNTDTRPPTISVNVSGSSGAIGLAASADDDVGVSRVEFHIDGLLRGSDDSPPYALTFDSTALANGPHSLVGKAYDAAGNVGISAAAAFTVDNAGTGGLIVNGGFEAGRSGWSGSGRIGSFPGQPPFEGSQCAWLGGKGSVNTSDLYQTLTIPAGAASATLSFALHIDSAERTNWLRYDTLQVQVRNATGSPLKTLASYSNLDHNSGYAAKSLDLSTYQGQTVQIYFKAVEDSSYQTSFVLDRVRLSAP